MRVHLMPFLIAGTLVLLLMSPIALGGQAEGGGQGGSPSSWHPAPGSLGTADHPLRVGMCSNPPFSSKDGAGQWTGLAVWLWRMVAVDLNLNWEIVPCTPAELEGKLIAGEVDIGATGIAMTPTAESDINFTPPFDAPGLAAAVRAGGHPSFRTAVSRLWDPLVLVWLAMLLIGTVIFGGVVHFIERRSENETFGKQRSMRHALWWAWVTGSTVGYGDVVPKTHLGRFLASIWILLSLIIIAMLTGVVTSRLTLHSLQPAITTTDGLHRYRVGMLAVGGDEPALVMRGVHPQLFETDVDALTALAAGEIDVFARARRPLQVALSDWPSETVTILSEPIANEFMALGLSNSLPTDLRERISKQVLIVTSTPAWQHLLESPQTGGSGK